MQKWPYLTVITAKETSPPLQEEEEAPLQRASKVQPPHSDQTLGGHPQTSHRLPSHIQVQKKEAASSSVGYKDCGQIRSLQEETISGKMS